MENVDQTNQNNGLEILNKVIETNQANIEKSIELIFAHEDTLNLIGRSESTLRKVSEHIKEVEKFMDEERVKREVFIKKIPTTLEAEISKESVRFLNYFETKILKIRYFMVASISILILTVLISCMTSFFAFQWYSKSIASKSEVRQNVFDEFKSQGLSLYNTRTVREIEKQNKLLNVWIEKYPEDAESFEKFKAGYDAVK